MNDCRVPAKNRGIAYSPTRELADNCNEKESLIHRHNRQRLIARLRRVKMHGAQSWLIPDKSTLQNHYVEINIDRSHQNSRY